MKANLGARLAKLEAGENEDHGTLEDCLDYLDNPEGAPPRCGPGLAAFLETCGVTDEVAQ